MKSWTPAATGCCCWPAQDALAKDATLHRNAGAADNQLYHRPTPISFFWIQLFSSFCLDMSEYLYRCVVSRSGFSQRSLGRDEYIRAFVPVSGSLFLRDRP